MKDPHDLSRDELLDELVACEADLRRLEAKQSRLASEGAPSGARPVLAEEWRENDEKMRELQRYIDHVKAALAAYPPR